VHDGATAGGSRLATSSDLVAIASCYVGPATGPANALSLTPSVPLTALQPGTRLVFYPAVTNTSSVTVSVSGLLPVALTKADTTALVGGELTPNVLEEAIYDGSVLRLTRVQGITDVPGLSTALGGLAPLAGAAFTGNVSVAGTTTLAGATVSGTVSAGAFSTLGNVAAGSATITGTATLNGVAVSGNVAAGSFTTTGSTAVGGAVTLGNNFANFVTVTGSVGVPTISAAGGANSDLQLSPTGTGKVRLATSPPGTDNGTAIATTANVSAAQNNFGRNRVDNGNMEVAQRTLPVTVNGAYSLDRWYAAWTAGSGTVSQGSTTTYSSRRQLALGVTGLTVGNYVNIVHRIPADRSYDLAGSSVTLQINFGFTISAGSTAWTMALCYANSTDNFSGVTQIGSAITFTPSSTPGTYTATFAVPAAATTGLHINIVGTQSGSTGNLTAGLTSVQLEAGATATPFERLDQMTNQARCQRFYIPKTSWFVGYASVGGITYGAKVDLPVTMHHLPTVSVVAGGIYINCSYLMCGSLSADASYIQVASTAVGNYSLNAMLTCSADL
jgi:hypothetical protein